jgi:hypothetical protein
MERFESLGSNCEFGFVLKRCGLTEASLLRWAEVPSVRTVTQAVLNGFEGIYQFDNLHPFNGAMVRDDGCGIHWHTLLRCEQIDPQRKPTSDNFRFIASQAERRRIWSIESKRMALLALKTRAHLRDGSRIFVYRPSIHEPFPDHARDDLFAALNKSAPNRLLVVTEAKTGDSAGTVKLIQPGLLHGQIDQFAPGDRAHDVSFACWLSLCQAALTTFG